MFALLGLDEFIGNLRLSMRQALTPLWYMNVFFQKIVIKTKTRWRPVHTSNLVIFEFFRLA